MNVSSMVSELARRVVFAPCRPTWRLADHRRTRSPLAPGDAGRVYAPACCGSAVRHPNPHHHAQRVDSGGTSESGAGLSDLPKESSRGDQGRRRLLSAPISWAPGSSSRMKKKAVRWCGRLPSMRNQRLSLQAYGLVAESLYNRWAGDFHPYSGRIIAQMSAVEIVLANSDEQCHASLCQRQRLLALSMARRARSRMCYSDSGTSDGPG